jgi:hypothetical protein
MNELVITKAHGLIISILDGIDNNLLPDELKTRDKSEPGRLRKMLYEKKLARIISKRFKRQKEKIALWLSMRYPERSKVVNIKEPPPLPDDLFDDDESDAELHRLFTGAYMHGVNLHEETASFNLDYSVINERALAWAHKNTSELLIGKKDKDGNWQKGIDEITIDTIKTAIGSFVETPGMTISDVVNQLPFDTGRSFRVARTEITHVYAQAELQTGIETKKEYPDVRVTKTWESALNERTCELCGGLHGVEVDIDDDFPGGYKAPPAHPWCDCSISVRTRI